MNYSMYLCFTMATLGRSDSAEKAPAKTELNDVLEPMLQRLRQLIQDFCNQPIGPQIAFELEPQIQELMRDMGRVSLEWAFNQIEPSDFQSLPQHVEFEGETYSRTNRKTPQEVATLFGKIRLWRVGYRSMRKTGDPTLFPLIQQLGIVAGATPALAERAAYYQAEAGATQRRTLERLKQTHGVVWGVKKLRQVIDRVAKAMSAERHEVQVEKVLQWMEQAWSSHGKHKPVLSLGRDGISFGTPVRGGTIFQVASAGTVTVLDRRGDRLGTVYLACTPESKQVTMSQQLTRLIEEVLRRWDRPLPRLCYVTDAGDNETIYFDTVLRQMKHPSTEKPLVWIRVLDYYHASERLWKMADALFGSGPTAKSWTRRMQQLLKQPNGIRRVLNSASVFRGRLKLSKASLAEFNKAYNYLRTRTKYMRYAAYERVGIPLGSGVTEAACKTIYTQRLKLSGMRWKKAGAQTILNLRVLLLSGVWIEAYQRTLTKFKIVEVPTCDSPTRQTSSMAA